MAMPSGCETQIPHEPALREAIEGLEEVVAKIEALLFGERPQVAEKAEMLAGDKIKGSRIRIVKATQTLREVAEALQNL